MRAAIIVGAAVLALAACTTTGEVGGHKVRATGATTVTETKVTHTGIHAAAPQWFKDSWVEYLDGAKGGYATMAVDRRLRGVQWVYCRGGGCQQMRHDPRARSFLTVQYKHGALKGCRAVVRENYPAAKPNCAIYAINENIVWKGPLPWE